MTQWLMAREAVGLVNEGRFDKPFIPRFDIGGHPLQQEVTASEIGSFLRMALNIPSPTSTTTKSGDTVSRSHVSAGVGNLGCRWSPGGFLDTI